MTKTREPAAFHRGRWGFFKAALLAFLAGPFVFSDMANAQFSFGGGGLSFGGRGGFGRRAPMGGEVGPPPGLFFGRGRSRPQIFIQQRMPRQALPPRIDRAPPPQIVVRPPRPRIVHAPPVVERPTRPRRAHIVRQAPVRVSPPARTIPRAIPPTRPTAPPALVRQSIHAAAPNGSVYAPAPAEKRIARAELLLQAAPDAPIGAILRDYRLNLVAQQQFFLLDATILRVQARRADVRAILQRMAADGRIRAAQPNFLFALQEASSAPAGPPQYALQKMALGEAHLLARGENVKIALIDTGVAVTHPELSGVVSASFDALVGLGLREAPAANRHGTAMAGAMTARFVLKGAAPGARLLTARAFSGAPADKQPTGDTYHILQSLDWAFGQGARVFNLSFAGPRDPLLGKALAAARQKGVIAVAAAGNDGVDAPPAFPAAEPGVLAIAATDAEDKLFARSIRGPHIALSAPGVDVIAAAPADQYDMSTGTSIAAAHVSGVIALLLQIKPDLSADDVARLLRETADPIGPEAERLGYGAGRVNAASALAKLKAAAIAASNAQAGGAQNGDIKEKTEETRADEKAEQKNEAGDEKK